MEDIIPNETERLKEWVESCPAYRDSEESKGPRYIANYIKKNLSELKISLHPNVFETLYDRFRKKLKVAQNKKDRRKRTKEQQDNLNQEIGLADRTTILPEQFESCAKDYLKHLEQFHQGSSKRLSKKDFFKSYIKKNLNIHLADANLEKFYKEYEPVVDPLIKKRKSKRDTLAKKNLRKVNSQSKKKGSSSQGVRHPDCPIIPLDQQFKRCARDYVAHLDQFPLKSSGRRTKSHFFKSWLGDALDIRLADEFLKMIYEQFEEFVDPLLEQRIKKQILENSRKKRRVEQNREELSQQNATTAMRALASTGDREAQITRNVGERAAKQARA